MKPAKTFWLVSLFAILGSVGLVAAVVLFQQTQPAIPPSGIAANCPTTSATPANVTLGGSGQVTFSCDSNAPTTHPAFTNGAPVIVSPTVTGLVAPYNTSGLYIYVANGAVNTGNCGSRTGALKVSAGVATFIPGGSWNYCAKYEIVGLTGLPQFTVAWNV